MVIPKRKGESMSESSSTQELLGSIDAKLNALVALTAHSLMQSDDFPDPSYPSLDLLLAESGMSNADIGRALGKSAGAARMQISRDRKKG